METKKILVVDDDIDVINIIQTILENENYEVVTANSSAEAFEKLNNFTPDLAILDVMMTSQFEGFEMAEKLGKDAKYKNLPILIQTSVEVLSVSDPDIIQMAKEYRKNMDSKDLEVLLIQNMKAGVAGVDYKNEKGETVWVSVSGFIPKPIDAKKLLPEVKRLLA